MKNLKETKIQDYLNEKNIAYKVAGNELITNCVFCDDKKGHLYFNAETTKYDCKKCGAQGNIFTLAQGLGDFTKDESTGPANPSKKKVEKFTQQLLNECHASMSDDARQYLNNRGITDELIDKHMLGVGYFYGRNWITIPIKDEDGEYAFFKLRQNPNDTDNPEKYMVYPPGSQTTIFNSKILQRSSKVVICEGELDCIVLNSHGVPAISSTGGASTFKTEWLNKLVGVRKLYLCLDNDGPGQAAAIKHIQNITKAIPTATIYNIVLPEMDGGNDVTDYLIHNNGTTDALLKLATYAAGKPEIDPSNFKELEISDLIEVMDATIKDDNENKVMTFLCMLTAYTDDSQFNISFNAPSSTGKSYIPTEVAQLFPKDDIIEIGYVTATAFFHENGDYDKESNKITIDLSRKIIIFLDQPHMEVMERLRPMLSHDSKEMLSKITDKNKKGGIATKNVVIKGYSSVIFCSAGLRIDEQEGTRFILLSPEVSQDKLLQGIQEKIRKESDKDAYYEILKNNPKRQELIDRIEAIREERIDDVKIDNPKLIEKLFMTNKNILQPRHQRDIGRLLSLIKAFALLNLWHRNQNGGIITATEKDIDQALKVWANISVSQEYNIPPYVYNLFNDVIIPCYKEVNSTNPRPVGITKADILRKHFQVCGKAIEDHRLRQQILPMLEMAGLISHEQSEKDKRVVLYTPCTETPVPQNNSEPAPGVKPDIEPFEPHLTSLFGRIN